MLLGLAGSIYIKPQPLAYEFESIGQDLFLRQKYLGVWIFGRFSWRLFYATWNFILQINFIRKLCGKISNMIFWCMHRNQTFRTLVYGFRAFG